MKRSIIFEETVKVQHRIIVDYENEEELDKAIANTEGCDNLDDCVDAIDSIVHVCQVDESWAEDSDGIEYYDDYLAELDGYKEQIK